MNEQFSKLTLHNTTGSESHLPLSSQANAKNESSTTLRKAMSTSAASGSTSSQYSNINANLQARVIAFREQRVLKRSNSEKHVKQSLANGSAENLSSRSNSTKRNSDFIVNRNNNNIDLGNNENPQNIQQIVNKPLPPLPQVPGGDPTNSSMSADNGTYGGHDSDINIEVNKIESNSIEGHNNNNNTYLINTQVSETQKIDVQDPRNKTISVEERIRMKMTANNSLNPIRMAPRRPPTIARAPLGKSNTMSPTMVPNMSGKPSLMARRGLKLPPGGMSLKQLKHPNSDITKQQEFEAAPVNKHMSVKNVLPGQKSNPGSLLNAVQSTSTSSSAEVSEDTVGTNPDEHDGKANNDSVPSTGSNSESSGSGGLFANFSKYVDIKSGSLNFAGKLSLTSKGINFNNGSSSNITLDELEYLGELGHGNYGNVSKVLYKPTNVVMAMKEVRLELDESKFRHILMELEVLHKCNSPFIVDFYGAFFIEGAVYMCMEYMDGGSLDKIYDYTADDKGIDEPQLAYITESVIRGLRELKEVHNIIHRDVKPTNILCSATQGTVKLCDFGVSGNLVASLAKTNIGCQSYMAPERIRSLNPDTSTYSVQSDVWSLGLSILELALGDYPYPPETFDNIFSQLSAIVDGPPPKLPVGRFSAEAQDFVSLCLQKNPDRRPTYSQLLTHPWLLKYRDTDAHMVEYITERLQKRKTTSETQTEVRKPALHMGGL